MSGSTRVVNQGTPGKPGNSKGLFTWIGGPRSSGGWFLLLSHSGGHKTKETYPTRPGSPTPCKQALRSKKTILWPGS